MSANENQIVVYQPNETVRLETRYAHESIWLTQLKIAELFGVQKAAISKHLKNIYSTGELNREAAVPKMETVGAQSGKFTKTICGICHDRFTVVDQKGIFWEMRRRNAYAFRRGDSARAEPEGRTSVRGASLKDAGRLTFAAAKMGAEVIPGLLDSIRKATSERREYGKGKKAARV